MEERKTHAKRSAKKVFNEFWKEAQKDNCDRKTLASISFDAGHSLRHEDENTLLKTQLLQRLEFSSFILMVDDLINDCKSVYEPMSDLDVNFIERFIKIKSKIKKFSNTINNF